MKAIYDEIGQGYDLTRQVDPSILAIFIKLLKIQPKGEYLDIACGTGNYTTQIAKAGGYWSAIDQSEIMLSAANAKSGLVRWQQSNVENMPYSDSIFDGAMCSLAIHHFIDLSKAFKEIARLLKYNANLVVFTSTPEQMAGYWLNEFFPNMMLKSCQQMPSIEDIEESLLDIDLEIENILPFFINNSLQDLFLYSGKQRPEMYLSQVVRAGISSFSSFCVEDELTKGIKKLTAAIKSRNIVDVINKYNNSGDYCFILLRKA